MIPRLDARALDARTPEAMDALRRGAEEVGFLTVHDTGISTAEIAAVIDTYRAFFRLPEAEKRAVDMARTGSNRGWGAPRSEQVDPAANPDFKEVFDCGFTLPEDDPLAGLSVYAPNLWPKTPPEFRAVISAYYDHALEVSLRLLRAIATAIGAEADYFDDKFAKPMALLRGNYYPPRPGWAGDKDFGIGAHTDYGCLTLLAADGTPGLEVLGADGNWLPVNAQPGEFVINFGEMLEMWTGGRVKATLHRVIGGSEERISVPLFFNPAHDTNVAPMGSSKVIRAGDHLEKRFNETYLHLAKG
ncbi:isopenicillin N synthase family dioxygenase [Mesobacterium pallidum]|uniref:isopenicillin N synthase family dioxygenase n=1 Tax=Mesobacterium pallidum TaxID=2872037 RepID=UPI001EE30F52|nr:2-oxoglutarate and iron-dependent oxygenase domain-containing protein [Mesobacterium pallidum]